MAFEHAAEILSNNEENTYDRQSVCYKTGPSL